MSREGLPAVPRRLILQSLLGWSLVAVGLGAGPPAPKPVPAARPSVNLRDPTNVLSVHVDRTNLIFKPQEALRAAVSLSLIESRDTLFRETNARPAKAILDWKLLPAGHSRSVAAGTIPTVLPAGQNGPAAIPFELALPAEEGVYDLWLSASARRHTDADLIVQVVVVNPARPNAASETGAAEELVDSFVPATGLDHAALQLKLRLAGVHLSFRELPRSFGAPQVFDVREQRFVDDWQTFWIAGNRLTEYLRYRQHNALLLGVDGASPKNEVLELLLRLFDREGLVLVPELKFDMPLQPLERLLRENPDAAASLQLVNGAGQTRGEVDGTLPGIETADNRTPHEKASRKPANYNILSPQVQNVILQRVRDVVESYAPHVSFGGVAFELGLDSCLQLPGLEWGYDADTIGRFEQATRLQVPRAARPEAQQQAAYRYLTTTARREWIRYRCGEVARFHRQLVELVLAARPDAQVFFSGRLWAEGGADTDTEGAVLDFVRSGGGPGQLLQCQGLDFSQAPYAIDARVTVLRPIVQLTSGERLSQAAAATLNHSPAIDALYRVTSSGGILYSPTIEPQPAQLPGNTVQAATAEPVRPADAQAVIQNYSHLLATLDVQAVFDGSTALPLSSADPTRRVRTSIAALPRLAFHPAGPQPQPVVVRTAHHGKITWLYAVNDSSLPVAIDLDLDCRANTVCHMLDGSRAPALEPLGADRAAGNSQQGNRARLHVDLRGNDLWACRFERASVAVVDTRLTLADETLARVEQQIDRLTSKMQSVANLARAGSRQLPNPGFEQQMARTRDLPGWELPIEQAGWSLDENNPRSGHKSLAISAAANKTALASPVLTLEGNRFVTMSLWLRSNKPSTRVRIVFEATIADEPFRHDDQIEAGEAWQQHFFRVDPLPPGTIENARLSVRPVDSCKLWVDDVEIGTLSFSSDEVRQLTKTLSSVKLAWEAGRYADCQRLLDGYWGQLLLAEPAAVAPVSDKPRLGDRVRNKSRR